MWGSREERYEALLQRFPLADNGTGLEPDSPLYLFIPIEKKLEAEFHSAWHLYDIFGTGNKAADNHVAYGAGFVTQQDSFAIGFHPKDLVDNVQKFLDPSNTDKELKDQFKFCSTVQWDFARAKRELPAADVAQLTRRCLYRPFDYRYTVLDRNICTILRKRITSQFDTPNLGLLTTRRVTRLPFNNVFVTNHCAEYKVASHDRNTIVFPLWIRDDDENETTSLFLNKSRLNFSPAFLDAIYARVGESGVTKDQWIKTYGSEQIFYYAYAVFHSVAYRKRYAEFLKIDFPRLPLPGSPDQFSALAQRGGKLVALHLLKPDEAQILEKPEYRFAGSGEARVEKGYPKFDNGKVMINDQRWFEDVPKETWEFHVGGYQVLQKWLKDRAGKGGKNPSLGRVLTDKDILHYCRVITSLTETRRIMTEIDQVIDQHGGWPDAFYVPPPPPPTIEEIIQADENGEIEYKSTFQWDVREQKKNPDLQKATLKTLAAFLNSQGGTLVIGVTDDREIFGLERDLSFTKGTTDQFERTVRQSFDKVIGVDFSGYVKFRFAAAPEEKQVCIMDVEAAPEPAFLKLSNTEEFYIRRGNASVPLSPKEQHDYVRKRFRLN